MNSFFMNFIIEFFGESDLTALQMSCRAIVMFFISLAIIRIAGRRSFGMHSALDNIIVILLGTVLGRVVVGASPVIPTVLACLTFAILHRLVAWLGIYFPSFGNWTKGTQIVLYKDGKLLRKNMLRSLVSEDDIMEGVRRVALVDSLDTIDKVYMDRSGHISATRKTNVQL
jgi:uncharacterized membrane protein YcaP (DUF421 family)